MTLQEAGLLVSPSVFVFKRPLDSPRNQALRRLRRGATKRSWKHSISFADMPFRHSHAMADVQDVQKTCLWSSKANGSEMVSCCSHKTVAPQKKRKAGPLLATHLLAEEGPDLAAADFSSPSSESTSALICSSELGISASLPRLSDRRQGGLLLVSHPQRKKRKVLCHFCINC